MTLEWVTSSEPVDYLNAVETMEERVHMISNQTASECVWLLEHPPLYTAGTSSTSSDLVETNRFPIYTTGRGGQYTYHGPGQRVAYIMIDLKRREKDVRKFVFSLEDWIIQMLDSFHIQGERRKGRVGIWVVHKEKEYKIAAIGIRLRHWISYHGISLNIFPDLSHFSGIIPCGLRDYGVTSFDDLGIKTTLADVDAALQKAWIKNSFLSTKSTMPMQYA